MNQQDVEKRLASIEAKLDRLNHALTRLEALGEAGRAAVGMATDAIDARAAADPMGIIGRLDHALPALERLTRPEVLDRLVALVDLSEKIPGGVAVAVDSFDQLAARLAERDVDLGGRASALLALVERVTSPELLGVLAEGLQHHQAVTRILRSGAFEPRVLETVGRLAEALAGASQAPQRVGLWGALRAAGTAPVQHALGFAVDLAGRFGASLAESSRLEVKGQLP